MKIALSGKIGSGKSTIAKALQKRYGFNIVSISTAIRDIATAIAEANEDKLQKMLEKYDMYEKEYIETYTPMMNDDTYIPIEYDGDVIVKNTAFRKLLQDVGTIGREISGDESFWVKRTIASVEGQEKVVCDDVRLPAEKEIFEQNGYTVFRLEVDEETQKERVRKTYGEDFDMSKLKHHTETALDDVFFEHVVYTSKYDAEQIIPFIYAKLYNKYLKCEMDDPIIHVGNWLSIYRGVTGLKRLEQYLDEVPDSNFNNEKINRLKLVGTCGEVIADFVGDQKVELKIWFVPQIGKKEQMEVLTKMYYIFENRLEKAGYVVVKSTHL